MARAVVLTLLSDGARGVKGGPTAALNGRVYFFESLCLLCSIRFCYDYWAT